MKRTMLLTVSAVAIATLAAVSFTALAHPGQFGPFGGGHHMMGGMMGGHGPMYQTQQIKSVSFDELKEKLNLTDAQLPLWDTYVTVAKDVQENIQAHHESMDPQTMQEMSIEDRQTYMQSVMEDRFEDAKTLQAAKDKLVEALTPDQQKIVSNLQSYGGMPCGSDIQGRMHTGMMGGPGMGMGFRR